MMKKSRWMKWWLGLRDEKKFDLLIVDDIVTDPPTEEEQKKLIEWAKKLKKRLDDETD